MHKYLLFIFDKYFNNVKIYLGCEIYKIYSNLKISFIYYIVVWFRFLSSTNSIQICLLLAEKLFFYFVYTESNKQ